MRLRKKNAHCHVVASEGANVDANLKKMEISHSIQFMDSHQKQCAQQMANEANDGIKQEALLNGLHHNAFLPWPILGSAMQTDLLFFQQFMPVFIGNINGHIDQNGTEQENHGRNAANNCVVQQIVLKAWQ